MKRAAGLVIGSILVCQPGWVFAAAKPAIDTHDRDCAVAAMVMSREMDDENEATADSMAMFYLGRLSKVRNVTLKETMSALLESTKGHENAWFFNTGAKCIKDMEPYLAIAKPE